MWEFYSSVLSGSKIEWSIDGAPFRRFDPTFPKPRGKNPMYKAAQLLTPGRWHSMQRMADAGDFPIGELLELYRIRGKAGWRQLRTAVIEASIISETLLREYGLEVLKSSGFSNNKIKRLRDEMTFNNLLNVVLPLSLTKRDLRRIQAAVDAVDNLRSIRNDLVHGNIAEREVEPSRVEAGIDGAINLVRFLRDKLH